MSLSFVVGKRRSRVVFGKSWAGTDKIDNSEKAKREIKIRERMVVKNETRKLVVTAAKCKAEFAAFECD